MVYRGKDPHPPQLYLFDVPQECDVADCREMASEKHHFAPRALFGDRGEWWWRAGKWPAARLCKPHHDEWHQTVWPRRQ